MSENFKYDVFLSHNSKDKPRVRRLAERLRTAGLRVWFDEWIIKPGDDIYLAIERGLEMARVQVLCLSPVALGSDWVTMERNTVLFRDPTNVGRRFIPLLLADCELPDTLRRYKYVDYRKEEETVLEVLLTACQSENKVKLPTPVRISQKHESQPVEIPEQAESLVVLERKCTGHHGWVWSVAVSSDGTCAASGSEDKTVKIWDIKTGKCRTTLNINTTANNVSFVPNSNILLISGNNSLVQVWDIDKARLIGKFRTVSEAGIIRDTRSFCDGTKAVSTNADGALEVWEIKSGRALFTLEKHEENLFCLDITSDGKTLVSGDREGFLKLWDVSTQFCRGEIRAHFGIIHSVQITPDGRFAVSGSDDRTVKVWDLETGTCVGTLEGHQGRVYSVSISPDGTLIASAGFLDRTVRLWDWNLGICLQVIENFAPISVAFSPDGSRLLAGTAQGWIHVYRLSSVRPTPVVESRRLYVNAKVVLIGESSVGKTTLAHRLINDEYVMPDSTHGMNVWRLVLPLPPDATLEREALLWDLAGQPDYRLIHQLFLEETALALLLINPQKEDPFAEAGDWLKALRTAGDKSKRDVVRLLIATRNDVGGITISEKKIRRFLKDNGFTDWLSTGAKRGDNCSDKGNNGQPSKLKQLIAANIPWNKLSWTSTPQLLAELKNSVVTMRDQTDIRLLRFAELSQRLEQTLPGERVTESDVRTAVGLLANHGLVRPLKFGDLVLLRPDLMNGYAGAIIRSARAHKDEIGCVPETEIYRPDFDFTGVERLKHRPDEELLLRAMVQTFLDNSLCIAEETPLGRHLVFPSQYRREKDFPHDPDIFVSYSFSGEWQTVWTTLVVRLWYSQEFEHRDLWRNAAEFASPKDHKLGLKLTPKQGEGEATISLYFDIEVPDELKALFIEYVHRHLAKYACNVTRDRRYVCPTCGKPVKDLDAVRGRIEGKKNFITCQLCDGKVPLIDFIEQRLKSDPVASRILHMEETATQTLDTQALEQILLGHMMAICGEANQIFRPLTMFDYGINGEVEFKDNDGNPSGKKIYLQLRSGDSYLRMRKLIGKKVLEVQSMRHLEFLVSQPWDIYLVIRQAEEVSGGSSIRWMNLTRYIKTRKDRQSRQIIFDGVKLDMEAVWKVRDEFFPPKYTKARKH